MRNLDVKLSHYTSVDNQDLLHITGGRNKVAFQIGDAIGSFIKGFADHL